MLTVKLRMSALVSGETLELPSSSYANIPLIPARLIASRATSGVRAISACV